MFQGCRLELGNEEKEDMKDQKELQPDLGTAGAGLRWKQRPHFLTWERLMGVTGTPVVSFCYTCWRRALQTWKGFVAFPLSVLSFRDRKGRCSSAVTLTPLGKWTECS